MLKCDPRAFVRCPYNKTCVSVEQATFTEGSDCEKFNQRILQSKETNADHIRSMSDRELATFLYTLSRSCADHACLTCPIGMGNCTVMLAWLKRSREDKENDSKK